MKKIFFALIALSFSVCFCSGLVGCTFQENTPELVTISNADELANYIRQYYYNNDIQENTLENHYFLDKNYKLTQSYSKLSSNYNPEYPEDIMIETLPYSVTFINANGDFYSRYISTVYGLDMPDKYFLEEQSHEFYYKNDTLSGYAIVTADRRPFDTYPEFEERQRIFDIRNRWTFATADEFAAAKNGAVGPVCSYLGFTFLIDLFKVDITDWSDTLPHISAERFDKLDVSQNGDIVSFEIVYNDDYISSVAKGTLNVSKIDFKYEYSEIRHEFDNTVVETVYCFELVSLADDYTIDFDTNQQFDENLDYIKTN